MINILIVDDEKEVVEILKKMLILNGFSIMGIAYNGQTAVDIYKTSTIKPDVILMDYKMPVKNGIVATREILKFDKNAKIIFISADKTIKREAIESGAIDFLDKPLNFEEIIESIENVTVINNQVYHRKENHSFIR